jgi:uncharacterized protein (TIGR03437 family)
MAPQSLAVDAAGNIYYVDGISSTVRQILPSGYTLVVAGTGVAGYNGDGNAGSVTQLNRPNGLTIDTAGNLYVADTNNYAIRRLTPQAFSVSAVANAASGVVGPIAPGEVVTLYGTALGPATLATFTLQANGLFPTTVGGTSVTFNSVAAPIIYSSANAVAAVVPYEIAGAPSADVVVTYNGSPSATTTVGLTSASPGVFTLNAAGSGQAAAINADGKLNSAGNPAKLGSTISLYVTGEGVESPALTTGKPATSSPQSHPILPVNVVIGGQIASVSFAGSAPTLIGLMQVNVQVPAQVVPGNVVPVVVSLGGTPQVGAGGVVIGGAVSQSGVTIAVAP